jgi:hypothetical protein
MPQEPTTTIDLADVRTTAGEFHAVGVEISPGWVRSRMIPASGGSPAILLARF